MIDKALLAKIRKCLALAGSSNEHEAAAALEKARQLMDEHGLDDAMLQMADVAESTARASRTIKPPLWESCLAHAVHMALDVASFLDARGDRCFVGRGARAEVAAYAFAVLFRQLKGARKAYITQHLKRCKPGRKRVRADAFCQAWAFAVANKVAALYPEREPDEAVSQYLAIQYPSLAPIKSRTASSHRTASDYWRGNAAGREVNLRSGVGAEARPLALT